MKVLLAVLFSLCATTLWAQQENWPALHKVTGVAANDVLNIRATPDAASPIIGTLSPSAKNIEVVGKSDSGKWALINTGEQSGFASLAYLARQPGLSGSTGPGITRCFGTEPFWTLSIDPATNRSTGIWSTPQGKTPLAFSMAPQAANRTDRAGLIAHTRTAQADHIAGVVRAEQCSDGMSDRAFGLAIDLIWSGKQTAPTLYSGCCSIAP